MIKVNSHIATFIILLTSVGFFISVVHNHGNNHEYVEGIEYNITQDVVECTICASHFKFSSVSDFKAETFLHLDTSIYLRSDDIIVDLLSNVQNGRAPPLPIL